ncbi:MAG: S9 family peptidase [Treponema sp.]|nr:S9 family peptidase [Treponema sp.]
MDKNISSTNDYYNFSYIGTPDYNAANRLLAYTLSKADKDSGEYNQQIIVQNIKTNESRIITAGGKSETNPRFTEDGKSLLFISDFPGEKQIYTVNLDTNEIICRTNMRFGVSNPVWSPDGSRIAFLSLCRPDEDTDLLQKPLTKEEKEDIKVMREREPIVITNFGYKSEDSMGFAAKENTHLWIIKIGEEKAIRVSDGSAEHVMPVWSPDGESLLFTSNRCRPKHESIGMDLFIVNKDGKELKQLTSTMWIAYYPAKFVPFFTKDGKSVIVGAMTPSLADGVPSTKLFRVPLDGSEVANLWPENAPCHEATCFFYNSENYGGYYENAQLSSCGKYVYFISGWHGSANIFRANADGEPGITKITKGEHSYRQIGRPQNGKMIVLKGDFHDTPQVYLLDEKDFSENKLTDTAKWLKEKLLSKPLEMWIDSLDGETRIQGWVIPPQNMEKGKKYPAILYIHGGPTPFYGYGLNYEHQCITGAGFALILCNPRGSTGYGDMHARMSKAMDGTAMYDLLQFTDEAVKRNDFIDGKRLGITGGSYGGYMTNWIAAHTSKFKAAVTQRGIANSQIQYASSDMAGNSKQFESFRDFMIDNIKKSPVAFAEKIDIPLLILHPQNDMRCPVEHAHQLYTAVKDTHPDLPVRMVLFPKSNHSLTMNGLMTLRVAHYSELIEWFTKHL